jgi:pyruvate/2-oxoglutarate dehydrogenase complex dihydrolipoamide acyltransferase (E2) component
VIGPVEQLAGKIEVESRGGGTSVIFSPLGQSDMVMERTIFLQHYRVSLGSDGTPNELGRDGAAIAYEAVDERSREPVALTLVPVESIDPAVRGQFEEQARAVERLRHVNIAKVFDFGREGGNYVYVSERLAGETLAAWVAQHGPMPADATLRVAEQIVSVLSSASFHKLPYPPIEPSHVIVVPGQTPEGGWPLVKLTNFGLTGLKSEPENSRRDEASFPSGVGEAESKGAELHDPTPSAVHSLTAESRKSTGEHGPTDVRSEIYSLGATMYFLLTGVGLSPEALRQPPKFSGFPKPLRNLLSQMLHPNPDRRPKDLVVLGEMIRSCLLKIERRLALADRYGIPFRTTIRRPAQPRPRRLLRTALAFGALVVAAAVVAAVLFPESIGGILQRPHVKSIGILVGVPEASPTPAAVQNAVTPVAPATVLSQPANAASALANQSATAGAAAPNSSQAASPDLQQTQVSNGQPEAAATPDAIAAASPSAVPENSAESAAAAASPKGSEAAQQMTTDQSSSRSKKKRVASTSSPRQGSTRVRMLGITSDGRLIYRLPSGHTRIVAPDSGENQFAPRRHRRVPIQRDEIFAPPPQFGPDYPPYD